MGRPYSEHFLREADTDENEYGEGGEADDGIADMEESFDERAQVDAAQTAKAKDAGVHWLHMGQVHIDGDTQIRVRLDAGIVQDYAQQFSANATITTTNGHVPSYELWWGDFPALDVYLDGDYWLADGFHRMAGISQALEHAGMPPSSIRNWLVRCRVRVGSRREAILHAVGANASHGLRRTNADKRKAVETLLRDEEWRQWTDVEIARKCAVDPKTVGNVRHILMQSLEIPMIDVRKAADGRTVDTTDIGRKPAPVERLHKPSQPPTPAPSTVVYVEPEPIKATAPSYLPEPERIEIDDPELRIAGFHLIRTAYGGAYPDRWSYRYWWARSNDVSCGAQRATPELAIRDARIALDALRPEPVKVEPSPAPSEANIINRNLDIFLDAYDREARAVYLAPTVARTLPLPPLPDERLTESEIGRRLLAQAREWCRLHYGELTGRHTLLPAFERSVEEMIEPLDSLIDILTTKEPTL